MGDVGANLDASEEATASIERFAVEGLVESLDLLMVRRYPSAQQPPGRRQPLEQVDLHRAVSPQALRRKRPGGPGADDTYPRLRSGHQAAVLSAVLFSAKNSAFSSSAYANFSGSSKSA